MRGRRVIVGLAAAGLVLCACGKDKVGGATTSGSTAATAGTATTTTTARPLSSTEGTKAAAAVVQRSDLPAAGWKEQAEADRPDHETTWRALAGCLGLGDLKQGDLGSATSPTYVTGLAEQVTATVEYADPTRVHAMAAAFAGDRFTSCAQQAFAADLERNAPDGATVGDVTVARLDQPTLGQAMSASRASATVMVGPIMVPIFTDFVAVFDGAAVSRLAFIDGGPGGGPFPADLERSLVEKVVTRAGT